MFDKTEYTQQSFCDGAACKYHVQQWLLVRLLVNGQQTKQPWQESHRAENEQLIERVAVEYTLSATTKLVNTLILSSKVSGFYGCIVSKTWYLVYECVCCVCVFLL